MYHSFLIYSSIDGYLGCFQILAIVNNAAMIMEVHIIFEFMFWVPSDTYPEVELMGHKAVPFLIFWETSILFSTVATPICILTNKAQEFVFLHILVITCCMLIKMTQRIQDWSSEKKSVRYKKSQKGNWTKSEIKSTNKRSTSKRFKLLKKRKNSGA